MHKLLLLVLLLWGNALACLGQVQSPTYRLDKMMGTPVWGPRDVAVSPDGHIYMVDGGITKLDSTGRCVTGFGSTPAGRPTNAPQTLGVDGAGNLYVSCYNSSGANDFIRKYGPNGNLLLQFGSVGTGPGQFQEVHGMCVDAAGRIYVAEYQYNLARLQCFSTQGVLLFEYRLPNPTYDKHLVDVDVNPATGDIYLLEEGFQVIRLNAAGQLLARIPLVRTGAPWASYERTTALLVEPNGNLLVTASQMNIMRFSSSGDFMNTIAPFRTSFSSSTHTPLARDAAGNIFATDFTHQVFSNHLYKLSPAGALLKRWGNLTSLSHVRQDEAGNVYTIDSYNAQVRVYNAAGQLVLTFGNGRFSREIQGLALDALGNVYVLETDGINADIQKFNPRGQFIARFQSFGISQGSYQRFSGLAVDAAGNMYVSDEGGSCVRKVSSSGVFLTTIGTRGTGSGQLYVPKAVAVDLRGNVYAADYDGRRVQKFSPTGQVLRQFGPSSPFANPTVTVCDVDLEVDGLGSVYLASSVHEGRIFAADGSGPRAMPSYGSRVSVNRRATRILSMSTRNDLISFYVSTQLPPQNLISGRVYNDANTNCLPDSTELPLPGIVVVAEPGNYYGITDEKGAYAIAVDTGRYTVQQLLPVDEAGRTLQQTCATNTTAAFQDHGNSVGDVNFGNAVSTSPFLRVAVSSNRRRRCFRNVTTVSYGNNGYAAAANVAVAFVLPPQVVFISANVPHTVDATGRYVFQVGTLQPNDGGTIVIQDSVACGNPSIRGLTVCTQASITPPNNYPAPPVLTRAVVTLQGAAQPGNQARFVLRNTGAAMADSLALRVYQNSELALQHRYRLAAGDSLVLRVPASRPVVRVEADQPAGHPTQRVASATVEVRGLGAPGQANPDMLAMPPNAPGPETAEDCQPIVDSFDPNDKQVTPTGVTAQHYTPTGAPLHYKVRFQNTGTDDAYRVEVVDTLAADLDLRTLRVATASHPYRLAVTGHGRPVLTFTFDNINLPPSTRDAAGSNGFVQFSIQPKAGLPARALVENNADIFFDYNPPFRTNTTTNRIYDQPFTVVPAVALTYPAVLASPTVSQFVPAQGRAGTLVTVSGQQFAASPTGNVVRFNGVATPVLSATATSLTVRVPGGATSGSIQVMTGEGAARSTQDFTIYQPPTLATVAPAEGIPGSVITLTGTHFAAVAAQDTVWFNGVKALVQQASATAMQVVVPAGAVSGKIWINTLGGQVESGQNFTVWYPPVLTAFSPTRGKAGDLVTITGSNFAPAARTEVGFGGGAAQVLLASGTQLQVRVPASAQTGPLRVLTPGGVATSAASFTFLPAPVITAFAPAQASVGDVVTLTGTNFLVDGRPDTVFFGGVKAAMLAASANTASIRVPKGALSGPLTIAGTGGRSTTTAAFTLLDLSAAEAITVYPNPARGAVTLDWHRADFTLEQVQVYNALGQLVCSVDLRQSPAPSLPLQFNPGQNGLHLLVIQTSRGPVLKRITLY